MRLACSLEPTFLVRTHESNFPNVAVASDLFLQNSYPHAEILSVTVHTTNATLIDLHTISSGLLFYTLFLYGRRNMSRVAHHLHEADNFREHLAPPENPRNVPRGP